jgi:PAS domain-containing protein
MDLEPLKHAERLAGSLQTAVFIVDPDGNLLFYNAPAEAALGRRFKESGPLPAGVWSRIFVPSDEGGNPLAPEDLPLMISLRERRPAYGTMWIRGMDNQQRHLGVAAVPVTDTEGNQIGSMAIFWELKDSL